MSATCLILHARRLDGLFIGMLCNSGEAEAAKEFGKGLLTGPFHVNWLGVERFEKK